MSSIRYQLKYVGGRSYSIGTDITFEKGVWVPVNRALYNEFANDPRFEKEQKFVEKTKPTTPALVVVSPVKPNDDPKALTEEPAVEPQEEPTPELVPEPRVIDSANVTQSLGADLERMNKAALAEYADSKGIKLGAQLNKKDMIAAIMAAEQAEIKQ